MHFFDFIKEHQIVIDTVINFLVAIGTIGTVVTAIYLSYRDSRIKLKIFGLITIIFPDEIEILQFRCINHGKQPVIIQSFSFNPNGRKRQPLRLSLLGYNIPNLSTPLPKLLSYSDDVNVYFDSKCLKDSAFEKLLGRNKRWAKFKLKFLWRVVAVTNVGEFEGKLCNSLIEKILLEQYPEHKSLLK